MAIINTASKANLDFLFINTSLFYLILSRGSREYREFPDRIGYFTILPPLSGGTVLSHPVIH